MGLKKRSGGKLEGMCGVREASPGHIYKDLPEASGEGAIVKGERT